MNVRNFGKEKSFWVKNYNENSLAGNAMLFITIRHVPQ